MPFMQTYLNLFLQAVQYATTSIESAYHYASHDTYGISMYSLLERVSKLQGADPEREGES